MCTHCKTITHGKGIVCHVSNPWHTTKAMLVVCLDNNTQQRLTRVPSVGALWRPLAFCRVCLSQYTLMAREVHGAEYSPSSQDLDGEVVMRVGGDKKHGRYWIGDSTLTPPLLPHSPRFERGARALALRNALSRTLHSIRLRHSR